VPDLSTFNIEEQHVLNALLENKRVLAIDILSIKSQVNLNKPASVLLTLEFQGIVKSLPGKRYQLVKHR